MDGPRDRPLKRGLLLDTHIALWLDWGDARLRPATGALIEDHWSNGGLVYFSAISVWETAMLLHHRRVELRDPIDDWLARFLNLPGMEAVAVTHRIAARAYDFDAYDRGDPADRLLIATAVELDCPLVTYDRRILEFSRRHGRRYRFSAVRD